MGKSARFLSAQRSWVLPAMGTFDVDKASAPDICKIEPELHLARDLVLNQFLIVPGIPMPAVEVPLRRQRLPALGLDQLERLAYVLVQHRYDNRIQCSINESLIQGQNILDH